jgi:hypothetical protein
MNKWQTSFSQQALLSQLDAQRRTYEEDVQAYQEVVATYVTLVKQQEDEVRTGV